MTAWREVVGRPFPSRLDSGMEFSYRDWNCNVAIYLPPAIAQVVGWWVRHAPQWWLHRLGLWLGVLSLKAGDYYRNAWWSWPWEGTHGPWARRYFARHGYAAYRERYTA